MRRLAALLCVLLLPAASGASSGRAPAPISREVILASAEAGTWPYLAFPALLDLGDEVLVSYKRARAHAQDAGAALDLLRLDPNRGRASGAPVAIARVEGRIMQMGEWVRFGDGGIANYIDAQAPGRSTTRTGLLVVRSTDGGRTFGPPERAGLIEGVEYGYAFDHITEGATTWMLVMTFSNLPGGRSVYPTRPHAGPVDVVRSDDHGRTWRLVRSLTREFGDVPINESAFIRQGDGFLVVTRGYDNRARLHFTDEAFRVRRQADLTAAHAFITSHVGRPRLFAREGRVYLLGRNVSAAGRPMQLALFRVDVATLTAATHVILDNAEEARVTDGYYAATWFRGQGADARLHVVTYRGDSGRPPDLLHLAFRWDDVK